MSIHSTALTPLPLKLYESFMLHDERPQYPMTFTLELRLSGRLHQADFVAAFGEALRLHPLLTSRIERSRWGRSRWVAASSPPPLHWHAAADAEELAPAPIDILSQPGLCVWVLDHPEEPRVWLQFHHAATDGIGAMHFIGDLLARYGVRTTAPGETPPRPAAVAVERLLEREILWPDPQFRRGLLSTTVRRLWNLSSRRPRPLAGNRPADRTGEGESAASPVFPPYHTRVVEAETVRALKLAASRRLASLNDLTTLAMFRALRDWNRSRGEADERHCLRLSLPFSLRLPRHDDSPACNHLSLMMLSRGESELDDADDALAYIRRATEVCAQSVEGRLFTFWGGGLAMRFPWLFRLGGGRGCFCTAILANIGRVQRHVRGRFPTDGGRIVAGSVRLEALLGAACVRQGARVAASFGTYAGRLFLNMNCDPAHFDRAAGETLIDLVIGHLLALAEQPADSDGRCTEAPIERTANAALATEALP